MDLHYKQEVTVGGLVLLGVALFLGGSLWLTGRRLPGSTDVAVSFEDAGTLKRGSPVRVSGVMLGNVEDLEFQGFGRVVAHLSLDARVVPKRDASASLATVGLVADAVIKFNPGSAAEPLPPGTILIGTMERGLMDMGAELGGQAKDLLGGINEIQFKELSENLSRTVTAFQRLATVYSDTKGGPVAEMTTTMQGLQKVTARLDSVLAAAQLDRTLRTADSLMANLTKLSTDAQSTAKQLDLILAKVTRGEGTIGKFASDTAFYDNAQKLLKSLQELVDDLKKHPGKIGLTVKIF